MKNKINNFAHGTTEWAAHNINFCNGCSNDCLYCYAKSMAIRFKRNSPDNWHNEQVIPQKVTKEPKQFDGRIMFPSSHDITPANLTQAIVLLENLLSKGNEVLIVTKPNYECILEICDKFLLYKNQITFRFSLGSANNDVLKFWEPNAPNLMERYNSIKLAAESEYRVGISIEPFLDDTVEDIIESLRGFVNDSIWIGKANQLRLHITNNGHSDAITKQKVDELMNLYNSDYKFQLYEKYKNDTLIKWKDSLKKDFNLERPIVKGLDI